jgi:hypothetical protein
VRAFFLFLVLLNLIYFAVGDILVPEHSHVGSSPLATSPPPGVQPLRMIKTVSAAAATGAPRSPNTETVLPTQSNSGRGLSPKPSSPPARCYSLGPFSDKAKAETMVSVFAKQNVEATLRRIQQTQVTGYWIYLPPYSSTAAATAVTRQLAAKGLHDYYVVASPPNANAISLGLFRERSGAARRLARVKKMGFQPKLQVRTADKELFWLDYSDPGNGTISAELWANVQNGGGTLQRVERSCPAG